MQGPYVEVVLSASGARLFERITGDNVGRRLAIVLDNAVYSSPVIQEKIGGGRASITGDFDFKEARDLAIILRAGALPACRNRAARADINTSGKLQVTSSKIKLLAT